MVSPPSKPHGSTPPPEKTHGDAEGKKSFGRRSPHRKPSPSPSPLRRRGSRPRERVVERIVRDSGSSGSWPQLTKTNYVEWLLRMKLKLQARDLWDVIEYGDGDYRDDRTALDAIYSAVPSEMFPALAVKETATTRGRPSRPSGLATSDEGRSRRRHCAWSTRRSSSATVSP